jgi:hypothetical protein
VIGLTFLGRPPTKCDARMLPRRKLDPIQGQTEGSPKAPRSAMPEPLLAHANDLVEAIARRVVELMDESDALAQGRLATAREIAAEFGVTRDWVYANASELGAVRLGSGPKARLRFDCQQVKGRLGSDERLRHRAASRSDLSSSGFQEAAVRSRGREPSPATAGGDVRRCAAVVSR